MRDRILGFIRIFTDFADRYKHILDPFCGVLLALIPLLQHYKGLIDNASTTLLALMVPYLVLRMLPQLLDFKISYLKPLGILMLFFIYKLVDHGTYFGEIAQVSFMVIYFMAASLKVIDLKALIKAATAVAVVGSIALFVQSICYYGLGFHLQVVPDALLAKESYAWIAGIKTGLVGVNGVAGTLYRPAGIFLEPSHFFMYTFPVLFVNLFNTDKKKHSLILPVIMTVGMFLSTSGMGMAVSLVVWSVFFVLWNVNEHDFKVQNFFRKRTALFIGAILTLSVVAFIFVPTVRNAFLRIFVSGSSGSTAISGRVDGALFVLRKMTFVQNFIGKEDTTIFISYNMSGFMATMYKYGIIGIILSYEFYIKSLFKLDIARVLTSGLLLVVSLFSAHTHGTFFMIYYVMILMDGHNNNERSWICDSLLTLKTMSSKLVQKKA